MVTQRKQADGFSFVVILNRINKKSSQRESVRLEPHPPYLRPTSLEARHWGATYALYRFCNGIQLNRVLPPGPREYWNNLSAEHKNAPEHQKWMYDADPFAARKAVEERQAKAAQKAQASGREAQCSIVSQTSGEFLNAPEAKMASSLRDVVEDSIKKAIALYPDAGNDERPVISPEDAPQILRNLDALGFKLAQARGAIAALSQPSSLSSNLLKTIPPLQACIEYLILQMPECDLPRQFLPSANSSDPFVTATHSGTSDIKARWLEEKAVKECGWPAHIVRECVADHKLANDWRLLLSALNRRLIGESADLIASDASIDDDAEVVNEEELQSIGGQTLDGGQILIRPPVAPITLVVFASHDLKVSTRGTPPPMYIASASVPAYIRLHIVSQLLLSFKGGTFMDPGDSFVMAAIRLLEEQWIAIEDNGPPEISVVLQHLVPRSSDAPLVHAPPPVASHSNIMDSRRRRAAWKPDDRSDDAVKVQFLDLCKTEQYEQLLESRSKLPAFSAKTQFLKLLENNRCVIVVGETGCGKTTQLPQFVLDSLILAGHGSRASIVVTQPRRLSALGVASRVSAERLDDGSVGYAIRGESKQNRRTKLTFCTTGVVLRRLGSGDRLSNVSHVIVDEVHERSVDGDLLLLELKELSRTHPTLKVILMSATINHEKFIEYFDNAPLLTIPGFAHPVKDKYLEDLLPSLDYKPTSLGRTRKGRDDVEEEYKTLYDELARLDIQDDTIKAIQTISRSDRIDYDLILAVVRHIISTASKRGAILIFLPGVQEIRQCIDRLRDIQNATILPLHANLSSDEQRRVFAPAMSWKIIVATNVAETSITIDDVIYVIDSGKVKETHYDPETGLTRLLEQWVTRAAARQRRGRAGRTQPGVCYKLYTKMQERKMAPFPVPEIMRVPLESIALVVKVVHNDVKGFLSRALDPPDTATMDSALRVLEDLAALNADGEVTPLGRHMAMLPVDLRLGKMLILATIFKCLGPVLTVVACLSSKPLFVSPLDRREEATRARAHFATGNSDLLTDLHAYDECMRLRAEGKPNNVIKRFCDENFISASTIRDITSLRQDFLSSLSDLGFVSASSKPNDTVLNVNSSNENLLKAVILGGLWPRIARVSLPKSAIKFDRVQAGTVQRENTAKEFKMYDLREGRVFLHPASVLFGEAAWKSPFLTYFQKQATTKVFLRDATEVPIYGLLLFGGAVSVNHVGGGLTIGSKDSVIKLKAWPRIGILVNQLRRLLDAQLKQCIDDGVTLDVGQNNPVLHAMLALLQNDGLTSSIEGPNL
ncbi:uncharacterized protein FIBRA_00134 [Fibroporia radiculosa]|uniref:RNA helicase n=1 Tax=Fibroporia radiculosa TaxID=599839 RepID=J7RUY8_9APHY|nr:uncharacterized protein FIBRA_00134 [Fibroporia radiculosa]CCL98140.1 predicted protein [Fibroporia radiculosa]